MSVFQLVAPGNDQDTIVVDVDGTEWSRRAFLGRANRLARALVAAGVEAGDTLAIAAPNCADWLVCFVAAMQSGMRVLPINWHLHDAEIRFMLKDSGAKAVVVHACLGEGALSEVRDMPEIALPISIGKIPGFIEVTELVRGHSAQPPEGVVLGRLTAYTSATTGSPKAVLLPLENAMAAFRSNVQWRKGIGIGPGREEVHLCTAMLYYAAPLNHVTMALHFGHKVVLMGRWEPERCLSVIDRYKVTMTFMVPTMFTRLLKLPEAVRSRYSTSSLKCVIHSGAPCPKEIKRQMLDWWGDVIWETYGAAEGQGTIASPQDWRRYPGTVGKPLPRSDIRIFDADGCELAAGETGSVYLLPHTGDRFEYKGDAEKTHRSYRGDYISVGDVGHLNEEGYLFIDDRDADVIISSGMNIYPAEIEALLMEHPSVADCAVVGVAHELLGKVPKALVQLTSGASASPGLTAELLTFMSSTLSPMKLPKQVEYVTAIPRGATGKLNRRLL